MELAEKNPIDPIAVDALIQGVWFQNGTAYPAGKESLGGRALEILLRDHVRSEKLGEVCGAIAFGFRKEHETYLSAVLEKNPRRDVRRMALLSLAQFYNNRWHQGMIRYKWAGAPGDKAMDAALSKVIAEAEKGK